MPTRFNCVLYGEAGAGKTPLCGTLESYPETSPCLLLDVDMGSMSLVAPPIPTVLPVDKWSVMQEVFTFISRGEWDKLAVYIDKSKLQQEGTTPAKVYKSLVIDSATELEYVCRTLVLQEHSSDSGKGGEVPEQQDYLRTGERMKRMVRAYYRHTNLTVVMTAGVRDLKDERDGIVRHFPAFTPGLSKDIVRMTDLIMYMNVSSEKEQLVRTLQTQLSSRIVARDRSQRLAPLIKGEKLYFKDIASRVMSDNLQRPT